MSPYKHILCPTDFSKPAARGAERAVDMAKRYGARLTLLHIIEHFPENLPVTLSARENQDPKSHLMDVAHSQLAALAERVAMPEAEQVVLISRRSAQREIVNYAAENKIDLIVIGAIPHGVFGPLGSTTSGILNISPCSLLVVRDGSA